MQTTENGTFKCYAMLRHICNGATFSKSSSTIAGFLVIAVPSFRLKIGGSNINAHLWGKGQIVRTFLLGRCSWGSIFTFCPSAVTAPPLGTSVLFYHLRLGAGEDAHELDMIIMILDIPDPRTFCWQSSKLLVGFWEAILLVPIFVPGSMSSSRSRELACCSRTTSAKSWRQSPTIHMLPAQATGPVRYGAIWCDAPGERVNQAILGYLVTFGMLRFFGMIGFDWACLRIGQRYKMESQSHSI